MNREDKLTNKPAGDKKSKSGEWDSHLYGDNAQYSNELGGEEEDEREQ
jgi:hypothetical protein